MKSTKTKALESVRKRRAKAYRDYMDNVIDDTELRSIIQKTNAEETKLKEEILSEALLSK